jgi:hypothetical protein
MGCTLRPLRDLARTRSQIDCRLSHRADPSCRSSRAQQASMCMKRDARFCAPKNESSPVASVGVGVSSGPAERRARDDPAHLSALSLGLSPDCPGRGRRADRLSSLQPVVRSRGRRMGRPRGRVARHGTVLRLASTSFPARSRRGPAAGRSLHRLPTGTDRDFPKTRSAHVHPPPALPLPMFRVAVIIREWTGVRFSGPYWVTLTSFRKERTSRGGSSWRAYIVQDTSPT